jgi:diguanylate cyclase (GGDEF)-like protein
VRQRQSVKTEETNGGSWLAPTALDRERLLESEPRLKRARVIAYGTLTVILALASFQYGWWVLFPVVISVVNYELMIRRVSSSPRPEYLIAETALVAQLLLGVGIVLTGGAASPALPWLALPLISLGPRFNRRVLIVGTVITVLILLASTIPVDLAGFLSDPIPMLAVLGLCVGIAAFSDALVRSEIEQRGEAILDPLTGLLNRKALDTRFEELRAQAQLSGASICMIACDLDSFKAVNDAHGHDRGDAVLRDVAYRMRKQLRQFELIYRLGGEEFLVVLPGIGLPEAQALAERLRFAVADNKVGSIAITASFGVAVGAGDTLDYDSLFRAADEALYHAKDSGRNRVEVAGGVSLPAGVPSTPPLTPA